MLKIRKKQKDALADAEREAFTGRMVAVVRSSWPTAFESQGEDSVRTFIRTWTPVGQANGFLKERDVAHFLNVAFAVAFDFGEPPLNPPWMRRVLDDETLDVTGKVYQLYVELYEAYDRREEEQQSAEEGAYHGS